MSKLALMGGKPLYKDQLTLANAWPPISQDIGDDIKALMALKRSLLYIMMLNSVCLWLTEQ